jgi:hypothetical protein
MNTHPAKATLAQHNSAQDFNTAWRVTMPAELVTVQASAAQYHEPIRGLVTREVNEPELLKLFFD